MNSPAIPKTDYSKIVEYYGRVRLVSTEELSSRIIEYRRIGENSAARTLVYVIEDNTINLKG